MMFKLAFRNIFRHRARSLITLSTIVFGCTALIFVGGFFENTFWQMRASYIKSQTGHLQINKKGFIQYGKTDPYSYFIEDLSKVEALVKAVPDVDYVAPRIIFAGLLSTGETTVSFYGQGVNPVYEKMLLKADTLNLRKLYKGESVGLPIVEEGQSLAADDFKEVALARGLAQTMDAHPGMNVTLLTNTVNGSSNAMDLNTKAVFYSGVKSFDDIFLRVPLKTAQKLLGTDSVQTLVVYLRNDDDTVAMKKKLQAIFQENHLDLEVLDWREITDFYTKTVELFDMFHLIMRVVVSIVVILGVFNTMNMAVLERISEIGTLMALGIRSSGIMKLFLLEGLLLGSIGGALGLAIGSGIVSSIAAIGIVMPPAPGGTMNWLSQPSIVPSVLLTTFILCVIIGAISSLCPAYRASKLVITDALRHR